jgi:hypothetical protein
MDATLPADANANAMVVDEPEQQVEAMADPPRTPLSTEAAPTPSLSADDAEVEQRLEEDQAVPGTPVGPAPPVQASSDSNAMLVDEPERHAPKPASKIRMPAPLWTFLPLSKGVDQGAGSSTKPSPSSALSADPLPFDSSSSEPTSRYRSASVPAWPHTSAEATATSEHPPPPTNRVRAPQAGLLQARLGCGKASAHDVGCLFGRCSRHQTLTSTGRPRSATRSSLSKASRTRRRTSVLRTGSHCSLRSRSRVAPTDVSRFRRSTLRSSAGSHGTPRTRRTSRGRWAPFSAVGMPGQC